MPKTFPDMLSRNGNLTEDGQIVIDFMENMLKDTKNDPKSLNLLAGHYKEYFIHVKQMETMTDTAFAENFGKSYMRYAFNDMVFLQESEEQKKDVKDTKDKQTEIQETLDKVLKDLKETKQEFTTAKQQITKLNKKLNKKILEDETDVEDDDTEDDDDKKDDDNGADESTDDTNKDDDKSETDD